MSDVAYYSPEGLKKLRDELEQMEHVERPRVTKEIADARDKGDLSEMPNTMPPRKSSLCSNSR